MSHASAFVISCLIAPLVWSDARAVELQKILLDGDPYPLGGGTMTIVSPAWNEGRMLFTVRLSGPGISSDNDYACLAGELGSLKQIFRTGQAMPGGIGTIGYIGGTVGLDGWYGLRMQDSTGTRYASVVSNGLQSVVVSKTGDPAPDTSLTLQSMLPVDVASPTRYGLVGSASNGRNIEYRTRADGSLQLLCSADAAMPQLAPENRSLFSVASRSTPSAYLWSLVYETPGNPYGSHGRGLFLTTDSGTQLLIKDGDPQPVSPAAGARNPRPAWLGSDGSYVVLSGFVTSGNVSYGSGMYSGRNGTLTLRRLPSQVFVDQPGYYVSYMETASSTPIGRMTLRAEMRSGKDLIGLGDVDAGFKTVAATDTPAPGLPGVQFNDFGVQAWQMPVMNTREDIVFCAKLTGTGVTSSNDWSLWCYDPVTRSTRLLAREGDALIVNGVTETIGSLELSAPFYDASGSHAVFRARLTNNALGWFSVAVPEPHGFLLTSAWLWVFSRSRTRSKSLAVSQVA